MSRIVAPVLFLFATACGASSTAHKKAESPRVVQAQRPAAKPAQAYSSHVWYSGTAQCPPDGVCTKVSVRRAPYVATGRGKP